MLDDELRAALAAVLVDVQPVGDADLGQLRRALLGPGVEGDGIDVPLRPGQPQHELDVARRHAAPLRDLEAAVEHRLGKALAPRPGLAQQLGEVERDLLRGELAVAVDYAAQLRRIEVAPDLRLEGGPQEWRAETRRVSYSLSAVEQGFRDSGLASGGGVMARMFLRSILSGQPWVADYAWWLRERLSVQALDPERADLLAAELAYVDRLVGSVPVARLAYPRTIAAVSEVAEAIVIDLAS